MGKRSVKELCYNGLGTAVSRQRQSARGQTADGMHHPQSMTPQTSPVQRSEDECDDRLRNTARVYWRGSRGVYYVLYSIPQRSASGRIVGWDEQRESTGITDQGAKEAAEAWAAEHKPPEDYVVPPRAETLTLAKYALNFFAVGHQAQLNKLAERGPNLPVTTLKKKADDVRLNINPHLGNLYLTEITRARIKDWLAVLHTQPQTRGKRLAKSTCTHTLAVLREILERAVDEEIITANPAAGRVKLYNDKRVRGILERDEIRELLDERNIDRLWDGDLIAYTGVILAITLGLRIGEIQGLQLEHVHLDSIDVRHQWSREQDCLTPPKAESVGDNIGICALAAKYVHRLIAERGVTEDEDLVFYQDDWRGREIDKRRPMHYRRFEEHFYEALSRMRIDREGRNIVLHSGRHNYATIGNEDVGEAETRAGTRHKSDSAWRIYSAHATREGTRKVAEAMDAMLTPRDETTKKAAS